MRARPDDHPLPCLTVPLVPLYRPACPIWYAQGS